MLHNWYTLTQIELTIFETMSTRKFPRKKLQRIVTKLIEATLVVVIYYSDNPKGNGKDL